MRMVDNRPDSDVAGEPTTEPPATDTDRYGHISLGDGAVVIYDRQEPETWLQSDFVVEVGV